MWREGGFERVYRCNLLLSWGIRRRSHVLATPGRAVLHSSHVAPHADRAAGPKFYDSLRGESGQYRETYMYITPIVEIKLPRNWTIELTWDGTVVYSNRIVLQHAAAILDINGYS